ncbi:hypothetical protein PMG11_05436 [Penicillium brasilianum]|uniref:Methyltransferase domain-containing protein n=1 Tax=Penicillium brasilianum TaxID=104259 RepID=A0A0F7VFQ4_PENBI|nr:hypothetical protein PMG11_05436 [Penicillium brasilianum]
MGSHASDEKIYLLGRDEAETERYVFSMKFSTQRIKSRDTHEEKILISVGADTIPQPSSPYSHSLKFPTLPESHTFSPLRSKVPGRQTPCRGCHKAPRDLDGAMQVPTVRHPIHATPTFLDAVSAHRFLLAISGDELIHPSIPKEEITAVADLGTGTGIWLEDLATKFPNPSSLELHGFDISPAQFPTAHEIIGPGKTRIPLSVHDALQPYPPEHIGRYDLVHIRLLTAGLKQGDYAVVLKNARELLKPNGYIQWEEVDTTVFVTNATPELPAITTMRNTVIDAMLKLGLWPFAPPKVYDVIRTGGFHNIHKEIYTTEGKEHLHKIAPKWVAGVMRAMVPPSMLVLGQAGSEEAARGKVAVLIEEFERHCQEALALASFGVSVGQRCD